MTVYDYTPYENVIICGDIHGHFEVVYGHLYAANTLFIVAGDCGFGFQPLCDYDQLYSSKMGRNLSKRNNTILFIRGNHDNPRIFDGETYIKKRALCIPDYSVVRTARHNILCVGGAVSVDRCIRKQDPNASSLYWPKEIPVFDPKEIKKITKSRIRIDTVVSHSCPSFCPPQTKDGIEIWLAQDKDLHQDIENERKTMDKIWNGLKAEGHPVQQWWYGHYHRSAWMNYEGCYFRLLDINEMDHLKNF